MVVVILSSNGKSQAAKPWSLIPEELRAVVGNKHTDTIEVINQLENKGWTFVTVVPLEKGGNYDQEHYLRKD